MEPHTARGGGEMGAKRGFSLYKLARRVTVPSAHTWGSGVGRGRNSGGTWGDAGVLAGSHLPALQSVFPGNVPPRPLRWGRDLPWPCHPVLETRGLSVRLGSQRDGSLTGCARDRRRPRFVPLPSPLGPSDGDKPSQMTFSHQASTFGSWHQPGGALTGTPAAWDVSRRVRAPAGTEGLGLACQAGWGPRGTRPWDGLALLHAGQMDGKAAWRRSAQLQPPFAKLKA